MSFFGGDHSKSHWAVSPKQRHAGFKDLADRVAEKERMRDVYAKLKAAGIKSSTYFQYSNNDAKAKASQRKAADKEAKRLTRLTGIEFDVAEGCFL